MGGAGGGGAIPFLWHVQHSFSFREFELSNTPSGGIAQLMPHSSHLLSFPRFTKYAFLASFSSLMWCDKGV